MSGYGSGSVYDEQARRILETSFVPHSIRFNNIVDAVEARCMAADGPVTPTLQEISEKELAALWRAVQGMREALDSALEDDARLKRQRRLSLAEIAERQK